MILTRNSILAYLGEFSMAPITSTIREIPGEVFLSEQDGMTRNCAINFDHIEDPAAPQSGIYARGAQVRFATTSSKGNALAESVQKVSKARIGSLITTRSADKFEQVSEAVQFAVDL